MAYQPWDPNDDPAISYLRKRAYGLTDPKLQVVDVAPQAPSIQQQFDQQQTIQPGELGQNDSEFYKGLRQGALGFVGDTYNALGYLSKQVGADSVAQSFRDAADPYEREQRAYASPRIQRIEDVQSVGDLADFAMGMLGQAVPSGAATLATIPAGGMVGGLVGAATGGAARAGINSLVGRAAADAALKPALEKAVGAYAARQAGFEKAGEIAAGGLTSSLPQIGDISERNPDANPLAVIGGGIVAGALDVLPMMHGIQRVVKPEGILKGIGKQAFEESWTEGAQEVIARAAAGQQMFSDEALSAYLNNALAGGIAGGAFGGVGGVAGKVFGPKQEAPGPAPDEEMRFNPETRSSPGLHTYDPNFTLPTFPQTDSLGPRSYEVQGMTSRPGASTDTTTQIFNKEAQKWEDAQQLGNDFWMTREERPDIAVNENSPFADLYKMWHQQDTLAEDVVPEKYAAHIQALQNQLDTGKIYGSEFYQSPISENPYIRAEGNSGPTKAINDLRTSDPDHDFSEVPYLASVENMADRDNLTGLDREEFIKQEAEKLDARMARSPSAAKLKDFADPREYLKQFSSILKSPRTPGGADYESGFSLNARELTEIEPGIKAQISELKAQDPVGNAEKIKQLRKSGRLIHADVEFAEKQAKKNRSIQFDTSQGARFVDPINLTNAMMRKEVGRIADEKDVVKRAGTYFLNGLSALMANPLIQAKNFFIPDSTIIYREKSGREVRYGQIKNLAGPVTAAKSALTSITEEGVRTKTAYDEISIKRTKQQEYLQSLQKQIENLRQLYRSRRDGGAPENILDNIVTRGRELQNKYDETTRQIEQKANWLSAINRRLDQLREQHGAAKQHVSMQEKLQKEQSVKLLQSPEERAAAADRQINRLRYEQWFLRKEYQEQKASGAGVDALSEIIARGKDLQTKLDKLESIRSAANQGQGRTYHGMKRTESDFWTPPETLQGEGFENRVNETTRAGEDMESMASGQPIPQEERRSFKQEMDDLKAQRGNALRARDSALVKKIDAQIAKLKADRAATIYRPSVKEELAKAAARVKNELADVTRTIGPQKPKSQGARVQRESGERESANREKLTLLRNEWKRLDQQEKARSAERSNIDESQESRRVDAPEGTGEDVQAQVNGWVNEAQANFDKHSTVIGKMQRFASRMAKWLGITDILLVSPQQYADLYNIYGSTFGTYARFMARLAPKSGIWAAHHGVYDVPGYGKKTVIWINPSVYARGIAEVVEALGHEIGHAVFRHHWDKVPNNVREKIINKFQKWHSAASNTENAGRARGQKSPMLAADDLLNRAFDKPIDEYSKADREYILKFEEWFADQVSKWFETAALPLNEVDRFFKGVADTFKRLYKKLTEAGWTTTREVDDLLDSIVRKNRVAAMFDSVIESVGEVRGIRAALEYANYLITGKWIGKPQPPPLHETEELRTDINAKYSKGSNAKREQALVKDAIKVLRMYNAVLANINAQDGIELLRQMQVLLGPNGIKLAVGQEAQLGPNGKPITKGSGFLGAFTILLDRAEYAVLVRAANTAAVRTQMEKLLSSDAALIKEIRSDPNVAIGYMYILQKAGLLKVGPETFNTFGVFTQYADKFYQYLVGKTNDNARLAALLDGLHTEAILQRNMGGVWEMPIDKRDNKLQVAAQKSLDLYDMLHRQILDKIWTPAYARMKESNNPHIQWIARQFVNTSYEYNAGKGWLRGTYDVMVKMNNALVDEVFNTKFQDKQFMRSVLEAAQNRDVLATASQDVKDAVARLDNWFNTVFEYLKSVGMTTDKKFRKDYFPWFFDPSVVESKLTEWQQFIDQSKFDKHWAKLADSLTKREQRRRVYFMRDAHGTPDFLTFLNSDPQFRDAYKNLPKTKSGQVNQKELLKIIKEYVARSSNAVTIADAKKLTTDRLLGGEMGVTAEDIAIHNPQLRFINTRDINFLADAKASAQDRQFMASLMQKNIYTILHTYVRQAAKRGEYARRFGPNGEILKERIKQARALGATADQIEMAYNFIDTLLGTSGVNTKVWLDRQLERLPLPDSWKAKITKGVVINPKLQNAMGWMMVYQNYRLLALATLSSVIDPLGISIRSSSGGIMIYGIRQAIRSTIEATQGNKDDLMQIAEMLGTIDRHMLRESIIAQYANNYIGEKQTKANDFLFRYNGLEAWTRWTRLSATAAAMTFMKRHVLAPNEHSARYLQELGLQSNDLKFTKSGDVKILSTAERAKASPEERAADGRVRDAIIRFVDQSIVRPNAAQRPMWMSDPHVMLLGHLKSYLFGFYETILKRAGSEAFEYKNVAPMLMLLSFIPVMFAADALREWIQYGPRGAPWKRGWSVWDHIQYEAMRAGITGRGEIIHNLERGLNKGVVAGAVSYLGPTTQQLYDFAAPRPNWKQDMTNALPLNNIYKHWFDRAPEKTKTQEDVEKLGQRVRNIEDAFKQHAMI